MPAEIIGNSKGHLSPVARDQSTTALLINVLDLIAQAKKAGQPIGRRSLATKLGITEAEARRLIRELAAKGLLDINRGIKGLELTAAGFQASRANCRR